MWKRDYVVSASNIQELLDKDGNSLPAGGTYRFHAHIPGTGTDQSATAVYWNQNGTWKINVTYQSGVNSNHPEFIIDSGVPKISTDHVNNYTISVLAERLELGEGTGTDNRSGFGADAYLGVTGSNATLRYNPDGVGPVGSGNKIWHEGNDGSGSGLDADTVDGIDSGSFLRGDIDVATTGHINFSRNNDEKFALSGTSSPYFRFKEGSTSKAFMQWNSGGWITIKNEEDNSLIRLKDGFDFSQDGGSSYLDIIHQGNVGSGGSLSGKNVYVNQIHGDGSNLTNLPSTGGATPVVITANRTAVASDYVFVNASGLTVTLPSSPSAGDSVKVRIIGTNYATIARNSSNIESAAENFYHDLADKCATFTYANSSLGWQVGC